MKGKPVKGVKGKSLQKVVESLTPQKTWKKKLPEYAVLYGDTEEIHVTSPDAVNKLKLLARRNIINTMKCQCVSSFLTCSTPSNYHLKPPF